MHRQYYQRIIAILAVWVITACSPVTELSTLSLHRIAHHQEPQKVPEVSLWEDMRAHFQLEHDSQRAPVRDQIQRLISHKRILIKSLEQSAPYLQYVLAQVKKNHLPAELALLPYVESKYNSAVYSRMGAGGPWQLMPGTASGLGLKINWWYDGRRDLVASTKGALHYLTYLGRYFDHNWHLAMAAYDAGEGTVRHALNKINNQKPVSVRHTLNKIKSRKQIFWTLPLPKETKAYVPKLLALATIIKHPERYQIKLPMISTHPTLTVVELTQQIEFSEAAKLADIDVDTLKMLNPAFKRWATDPSGSYSLLIPAIQADKFSKNLANYHPKHDIIWHHHEVHRGETLSQISKTHHVSITTIKQINRLHNNTLHSYQHLIIPITQKQFPKTYHPTTGTLQSEKHPGPQQIIHHVNVGDTLHQIAIRYQVKLPELIFWNQLKLTLPLKPGTGLVIWKPKGYRHTGARFDQYIVKSGDSLSRIAHRFLTDVQTIKQANRLHTNVIHTGMLLKVPMPKRSPTPHPTQTDRFTLKYIIENGDSLYNIAKDHRVSIKQIKQWNKLDNHAMIQPDQVLRIYR